MIQSGRQARNSKILARSSPKTSVSFTPPTARLSDRRPNSSQPVRTHLMIVWRARYGTTELCLTTDIFLVLVDLSNASTNSLIILKPNIPRSATRQQKRHIESQSTHLARNQKIIRMGNKHATLNVTVDNECK